jgi:hypothetical protein
MNTTITIQGINYTIPNDKVSIIIDMLKAYSATETRQEHVKEVLTNQPMVGGRTLING